jgi:hypothetical protein
MEITGIQRFFFWKEKIEVQQIKFSLKKNNNNKET